MKDYEALSKKHFDAQAAEYDRRDTYYYSQNGKISCRDIAGQIKDLPYGSLLDVGCGTGFLMELLTKQRREEICFFGVTVCRAEVTGIFIGRQNLLDVIQLVEIS